MSDTILDLRHRLARLSFLTEENDWNSDPHPPSGLPMGMGPFYIREQFGPNYARTNRFDVCVTDRKRQEKKLFRDIEGIFPAFRIMTDCMEAWAPIRPVDRVYFIGTELAEGKLVKVGFSRDPDARLRDLQTAHGERLQIFATVEGGMDLERKYHNRWKFRRAEGEWFTLCPPILAEIARLKG